MRDRGTALHDAPVELLVRDATRRRPIALSNNATVALLMTDEHQRCNSMNPAAELLIGDDLAKVKGRPLPDVIQPTLHPDGKPYPISEWSCTAPLPATTANKAKTCSGSTRAFSFRCLGPPAHSCWWPRSRRVYAHRSRLLKNLIFEHTDIQIER